MKKRRAGLILVIIVLFTPSCYILLLDYLPNICQGHSHLDTLCPSSRAALHNNNDNNNSGTEQQFNVLTNRTLYGDNTCPDNPNRAILLEIFQRWVKLAAQNNITYFITTGTLLGAWRNEDIIPYDRDVDVLIDARDDEKVEAIKDNRTFRVTDEKFHLVIQEDWRQPYSLRRRFMCHGKHVTKYKDHCSFQEPLGRLIKGPHHLDIYDYHVVVNATTMLNQWVVDPSEGGKKYLYNSIFPLKTCRFMGVDTFCPHNPVSVLEAHYGKNLHPSSICKNGTWVVREGLKNGTRVGSVGVGSKS